MWRSVMMAVLLWPGLVSASIAWVGEYEQARKQAATEGLPLMVYFDARWCSWCHRYQEETLSDPRVSEYLRRHFLAVKVDWDARPDLVRHYGANGLPYTVVLSPDGSLRSRFLGLVEVDTLLARLQDERRGRDDAALRLADFPALRPQGVDQAAWQAFQAEFVDYLERLWWPPSGGLHGLFDTGLSLKWPQPQTGMWLEEKGLWLERAASSRASELARLWDRDDGGFFNYAEPRAEHLETSKLAPENAWMVAWLAGAPEREGRIAAASTVAMLRTLSSERGGLYQARQADAAYYALPATEREQAPPVDDIVRADGNGSVVWALACAAQRGQAEALELASEVMDGVLGNLWREGRLHHARRGERLGSQVWPEDSLYLLAAAQALAPLEPERDWTGRVTPMLDQMAAWATQAEREGEALHSDRAAILAWVAVQPAYRQAFGDRVVPWAIGQLELGAETLPDRLIPGLAAWQRYLGDDERPTGCF